MLKKTNDTLYGITNTVAILMFIGMIVLSMVQVFCRYVLKISLSFTEELARFLFIWVTFLGTAMAQKKHQHVRMELLLERLPAKAAAGLRLTGNLAAVIIYLIMIGSGFVVISKTMAQASAALNLPMGIVYAAVPVCGVLMILFMLGERRPANESTGGTDL